MGQIMQETDEERAERMRKEDAEAMARLREYIAEHRGNMLALNLMTELFNIYKGGR